MSKKTIKFQRSKKDHKFCKADWIILLTIMIIYSAIALYNLGYHYAPQTAWKGTDGQNIVLDMGDVTDIGNVSFFMGETAYYNLSVSGRDSTSDMWESYRNSEISTVFSWNTVNIDTAHRYIMIALSSPAASLKEVVITDPDGNILTPVNADDYANLFDEQNMYPGKSTFRDSTYFDEIYHARTAYEYIHGLTTYENTHPPLGKIFISIGIMIFGMNPFGWRIIGTLFGIFMIPVIYAFAKKMFEQTWLASIICLLFTFDFMHFTQTRIATIDVYVTFFIMLMYYFMYKYIRLSFYDSSLKKTLIPLGISGVAMGFGCACKWTGCYAGVGLALIFFYQLYRRYREYRFAKINPDGETDGISHSHVIEVFPKYTVRTLLFCILFFIIIPGIIYTLSYIPFISYSGNLSLIDRMLENQVTMFTYHSGLKAVHAYSSSWYQWPVLIRPVLFYTVSLSSTVSEGISSFGNPAVWWVGILATSYALYRVIAYSDKKAGFLLISYAAQFLPWVLVTRYTFMYHYFPSTPFVVLLIGFSMYRLAGSDAVTNESRAPLGEAALKRRKRIKTACFVYCGIAIALFILFYPVLSGMPISKAFVKTFLRWFKSWTLVL